MNDQTARQWRQAIAEAGTIVRLRSLASELMRLDHNAPQADLLQLCLLRLKHLARDGGLRRAGDWGW